MVRLAGVAAAATSITETKLGMVFVDGRLRGHDEKVGAVSQKQARPGDYERVRPL
jgi:hypothetical protein